MVWLPPLRRKPPSNRHGLRCEAHLRWIRKHLCLIKGCREHGPIQAHHVRLGAHAGMGQKPGDDRTVPICTFHHTELHMGGEDTFQKVNDVDLPAIAAGLAAKSPALRKMR